MKITHADFGPGKMFHTQVRVGGKPRRPGQRRALKVIKLRTYPLDSVNGHKLVPDPNNPGRVLKVNTNGTKPTRVGRFLRATKLDETPQIINIAKGEMSVFGTRPILPKDYFRLSKKDRAMYDRFGTAGIPLRLPRQDTSGELKNTQRYVVGKKLLKRRAKRTARKAGQKIATVAKNAAKAARTILFALH